MTFEHDRWTLVAVFDSVQETIDAEIYEGGLGEAAEFYAQVRKIWDAGVPEYLDEDTMIEGETVTITAGNLDFLNEPLAWLIAHTVPQEITITRNVCRRH